MKGLFLLLFNLTLFTVYSQEEGVQPVPPMRKVEIGKSGCFAYLPKGDGIEVLQVEESYSEDSSIVYTGEITYGDFNFAIIVVRIAGEGLQGDEQKESMLISYLDYLQESFGIMASRGYGKGHRLEDRPSAVGVLDYWEDLDGLQWAVKGWADEHVIAVLMLYGAEEYPYFTAQQIFLDGFRFE